MLDPCVRNVLCTLSVPVLRSIDGIVTGILAQASATLAQLEARSLTLGVQEAAINSAAGLATSALDSTLAIANFLPLDLVEGCADLGDLQQQIAEASRRSTAAVNDLRDDAIRATSLKGELDADIAALRLDIDRFNLFQDTIQSCIVENSTP